MTLKYPKIQKQKEINPLLGMMTTLKKNNFNLINLKKPIRVRKTKKRRSIRNLKIWMTEHCADDRII